MCVAAVVAFVFGGAGCKKNKGGELTKGRCELIAKRAFQRLEKSGEMTAIQRQAAIAGTVRGCEVDPDNSDRVTYVNCLETAPNTFAIKSCQQAWQAAQAKR